MKLSDHAPRGYYFVSKNSEVKMKSKPYVIVRTFSAGCFAGNLESRKGQDVVLLNTRRLWKWAGAASLSQLAVDGTSNPGECRFPAETPRHELMQAIEVIFTTKKAKESIAAVPVWKA
jgi:hypothetical protein